MVEGHAAIAVFDRDVDAESLLLPVDDELGPVYLVLNCDVFNGVVAREREAAPQEPHLVNVSIDTEHGTLSVTQLGVAEMNPVVAGLPTRLVPQQDLRLLVRVALGTERNGVGAKRRDWPPAQFRLLWIRVSLTVR